MSPRVNQALSVAVIVGSTLASALIGARASRHANRGWYRVLRKSKANPPDAVFGPVWSLLYGLSATSASRVALAEPSRARDASLSLWGVQQALNAAWSPLFFGKRKSRLALVDVAALLTTLVTLTHETRKVERTAANLLLPYIAWVAFASYLNYAVVKKNPSWLR